MLLGEFLAKHEFKLALNIGFLRAEISFQDSDKKAAWELYVELLTRITTQPIQEDHGDEGTALDSVFSLFATTREILKKYGSGAVEFSKIAIPVLNQKIRPFTAKWHKISLEGGFATDETRQEFRDDLQELQKELKKYNQILADIAGVEDLSSLEDDS